MIYTPRKLRGRGEKVIRPVRPNAGTEAEFRRRLLKLVDDMHASVTYWLSAAYKAHPPRMAQDEIPARELRDAMAKLARQWLHNFDESAKDLADYFATEIADRSDAALMAALRKGGFVLGKFKMTPAVRDIIDATVNSNVSLIKSIPQRYLGAVEGVVMRSVQTGRDLEQLTKDLQKQFGVERRRAILIARDQNNKATSAMTRARQVEMGVSEAIWMHSHAGKKPRPTHVKMDGKRYDVRQGMYDQAEGRYVFPGELINCRCTSRSVIAGFA